MGEGLTVGMTDSRRVVAALLLVSLFAIVTQVPAASEEEITLQPGESCMTASCHTDLVKAKFVHVIAADGGTCIVCHQPPDPGKHSFKLLAEGSALCTMCHDKSLFEGAVVHGPVADGKCTKCHDPHASEHYKQTKDALPDLCFDCHYKILRDHKDRQLPSPMRTFENKELTQHLPFGIGQCTMCHEVHASPNHRLLKSAYPEAFYTSYSKDKYICFNCHDDAAFSEPRTLSATAFRNGNLNLHYRHVNRKKGRTCRACHHHHGAENPKLIRETVPFGNRYLVIKEFELTETGGKCGPTCHPVVSYDRFEPVQNVLKVTPREGDDATPEALLRAKEEQLKK